MGWTIFYFIKWKLKLKPPVQKRSLCTSRDTRKYLEELQYYGQPLTLVNFFNVPVMSLSFCFHQSRWLVDPQQKLTTFPSLCDYIPTVFLFSDVNAAHFQAYSMERTSSAPNPQWLLFSLLSPLPRLLTPFDKNSSLSRCFFSLSNRPASERHGGRGHIP